MKVYKLAVAYRLAFILKNRDELTSRVKNRIRLLLITEHVRGARPNNRGRVYINNTPIRAVTYTCIILIHTYTYSGVVHRYRIKM